jgi:hypothetical protein
MSVISCPQTPQQAWISGVVVPQFMPIPLLRQFSVQQVTAKVYENSELLNI